MLEPSMLGTGTQEGRGKKGGTASASRTACSKAPLGQQLGEGWATLRAEGHASVTTFKTRLQGVGKWRRPPPGRFHSARHAPGTRGPSAAAPPKLLPEQPAGRPEPH